MDIPFYIVHGDDDPVVPVALSRAMRDAIARCAAERAAAASTQPPPAQNPASERQETVEHNAPAARSDQASSPAATLMYRKYSKVGHDSWTPADRIGAEGILDWMFA